MGVAGGLLALLAPLFTARIIDTVLPDADPARLPRICLGLAVAAMAAALFQITRAVAVLRLETRAEATVEAALWDRLLRLPPSFFRQYTAGDLAERAMGIGAIRQLASGAAADTLLGAVFSVFSLHYCLRSICGWRWWRS
jgi:ATP-binding cassette subfamily C protein